MSYRAISYSYGDVPEGASDANFTTYTESPSMANYTAYNSNNCVAESPSMALPAVLVRAFRWKKGESTDSGNTANIATVAVPSPPWFSNFGAAPPASRKSRLRAWRAARRASTEFHGTTRRRSSSAEYKHSHVQQHHPSPILAYFRNSSSSSATNTSPSSQRTTNNSNSNNTNLIMGCFGMQTHQSQIATSAVSTDPLPTARARKALY